MILKEVLILLILQLISITLCEKSLQLDNLKAKENDDNEEKLKTAASEGLYHSLGYGLGKYPYTNGFNSGYGGSNYGYTNPQYDYYGGYGGYSKGYGASNTYFYPNAGTGYSSYPLNGYGGYGGYGGNGGLLSYSGYQGYYNNGLGYDNKLPGNLGYGYYQQRYPNYDYNSNKYPYNYYGARGGYTQPGYVTGYRGYTR